MKGSKCFFLYAFFLPFVIIIVSAAHSCEYPKQGGKKLFVFGDSFVDNGNLGKIGKLARSWTYPYGITFPHHPTGRFSDGRVLSDFIASFMRIRSPIPYKYRKFGFQLLRYGMNFAVGGTGVFDTGDFQRNLTVQIDVFERQIKNGIFSRCDLDSSIALVAVSGNDYGTYQSSGHPFNEISTFMNSLMSQLKVDLKRIHDLGVRKVVVTNLHPLGCTPMIARVSNYSSCNSTINLAVQQHNQKLDAIVKELLIETRSYDTFMSLDVHGAFWSILAQEKFKNGLKPCCEGNTNAINCGEVDDKGVKLYKLCSDPQDYFYWDSVHPTQAGWTAAYQALKPSLSKIFE
ncbi:GDSL lipase/esterase protein [Dioscorea alata]|uniref:GDSL lipase/esterase protein n=1 Tax=Dioscorea alata TaxID=55571 RepID=A0ACB7US17_DIOAL|nr:GDSL lipase/esterase protein [Dioscorea alata]